MKPLFAILALFALDTGIASAATTQAYLNCVVDPAFAARVPSYVGGYRVLKITHEGAAPLLYVEVFTKNDPAQVGRFQLVPTNYPPTPENVDYRNLKLNASRHQRHAINTSGAAVQNDFEWATLYNYQGMGFASCR